MYNIIPYGTVTTGFIQDDYCHCDICPHCGKRKRTNRIIPYTGIFPKNRIHSNWQTEED